MSEPAPGESPGGDVVLLVNPAAGRGRAAPAGERAAAALRAGGAGVRVVTAADAGQLVDQGRKAVEGGAGAVVAVGGDGTVNLAIGVVATTGVPLGVIAAGTGNDNARSFGVPLDVDEAAQHLASAWTARSLRDVDAVRWADDEGRSGWFGGVLGAGFDSLVNERANRWQWPRGRMRYDLAVLRELPVFTPRAYRMRLDGEESELRAVLIAVGNGPAYGGGLRVCPDAQIDDGLLDVLLVGPVTRLELIRLYPTLPRGGHLAHPEVSVVRGREVRLESAGMVAYADGERLAPLPITCTVVPGALRVLTGPGDPASRGR